MDVKTVRRHLRADSVEQLITGGARTSKLDPFKPYLRRRLSARVPSAAVACARR